MNWTPSRRVLAWVVAALLAAPLLVYGLLVTDVLLSRWRNRVEYARTHTILDQPMTLDGAVLPAGAEVEWEDRSRSHITGARLPRPAEILGVRTSYLRRDGDGGWIISMLESRELDGWPCAEGMVQLTAAGHLCDCALSRATSWQGWILPERTMVNPVPSVRAVRLTINTATRLDMPLESPVVGLMPASVMLNDDGSPAGAGYERDVPHLVSGQRLADIVEWHYDPATYGMGRERPPVTVSGFVHPPDGAGGASARRHVVLPWDQPSAEERKGHGDVQR